MGSILFAVVIAILIVGGLAIKVNRSAYGRGMANGHRAGVEEITRRVTGSKKEVRGMKAGKAFVYLLVLLGLAGAGFLMVSPALPSLGSMAVTSGVVDAQAEALPTVQHTEIASVTLNVPIGSSILIVDGQEFMDSVFEHDKAMMQAALDSTSKVAISGDAAQSVQALASAAQGGVLATAVVIVVVGAAFIVFKFGNREQTAGGKNGG